ncbi:hypothetical protein I3842_04G150400 [Carya illinoinensis]|uniref:Uncharacterized protein n=1 Tax=Carya illinoinensis TaxID=32201 RepID=A0A922FD99_CARIL|nr:hypothetical protein I3842_04G150400 [Carya illinoinensis]
MGGDHLVIDIKELIHSSRPFLSPKCCTYKVPNHFRKLNEDAYTPRIISIGPFHHGNPKLQTMEKYKVRYLMNFMEQTKTKLDKIVIKPWLTARMQLDFLLLENQLPFFIIEKLYKLVLVTFFYFSFFNNQDKSSDSVFQIKHFVDLLRTFYLPPLGRVLSERKDEKWVLKIPHFTLDNAIERYARNLMALEQSIHEGMHTWGDFNRHYPREAYITDYFFLLDFLIDTGKDVGLLARKKIVVNGLGDDNATFVNNLGTNVEYSSLNSEYFHLCKDLVDFYNKLWHRWKAILRRDYLSSPWRIASTAAAIIFLVFTLVQTGCSINQVLPA